MSLRDFTSKFGRTADKTATETEVPESIETRAPAIARRSFLKSCGLCAGALIGGVGAVPGVASATSHTVQIGTNKRFTTMNMQTATAWNGSLDTWYWSRWANASIKELATTAIISAGYTGTLPSGVSRVGRRFDVTGRASRSARIDVPYTIPAESVKASIYKPYDDGTRAQNQLRIIIRNATTGTVLSRKVVLNQNRTIDGTGYQPPSTLNRTANATVTLNPGHRYEVFLAAESTAVVGYYGSADARITSSLRVSPSHYPRINEVKITF